MEDIAHTPDPMPRPSLLRFVFLGTDGLRAGWSLLLYFALLLTVIFLRTLVYPHVSEPPHAHLITLASVFTSEGGAFALVLLITFILSRIERRPLAVYGLGNTPGALHQLLLGLATGLVSLSLLVGILWSLHLLDFNARILSGGAALHYGMLWLFGFLLVGLTEDYLMRGFLQFTLARGLTGICRAFLSADYSKPLGFWTSAIILSIGFGAGHGPNPGESPLGLLSATLAGLIFCLALWRTGSLWWAIGFHCSWDWAQSFLYGVGDSGGFIQGRLFDTAPLGKPILSGGATGPEGSLYVLPVLALVAIVIVLTLPKHPEPPDPAAYCNTDEIPIA